MGRRSMSLIMALAMMFLITTVVIASVYFFISGTQREVQDAGSGQTDVYLDRTNAGISVEGARGNQVYVRNTGKGALLNFTVYVNGELMRLDTSESAKLLREGETGILVLSTRSVEIDDVVRVVSTYGARDSYVVREEEQGQTTTSGQVTNQIEIYPRLEMVSIKPGQSFRILARVVSATYGISQGDEGVWVEAAYPDGSLRTLTMNRANQSEQSTNAEWEAFLSDVSQEGVYKFTVYARDVVGNTAVVEMPEDTVEGFAYNWEYPDWGRRQALVLQETRSVWTPISSPRINEPVWINVSGLSIGSGNCAQNLRVFSPEYGELPFQVFEPKSDSSRGYCTIITQFNASRSGYDSLLAHIYYSPSSPSSPSYTTDLISSGNCYENSNIKLCLGAGDSAAITHLGTVFSGNKEVNLLSKRDRDDKFYSIGIQPSMQYRVGVDSHWCTNYTVDSGPSYVSNGPVAKVLSYNFSTNCEGMVYRYTYNLYMYSGVDWYELDVVNVDPIEFFENATGKSTFVKTKWDKNIVEMVPNEGWCSNSRCSYWGSANGERIGVGTAVSVCSNLEDATRLHYVLSIIPTNEADVSDKLYLEPGRLTTRTVFSTDGSITERSEKLIEEVRARIGPSCDGSSRVFFASEENN